MARLFVFGIGGTGSRVIKSLTMLLASGVKAGDFDIVPILIDPHKELKELNECKILLKLYGALHDEIYHGTEEKSEGFFKTKITTLKSFSDQTGLKDDFDFDEKYDSNFGEFLDLSSLETDSPTHDLLDLLYSSDNFNKPLSLGFKGNPNIGSVVLNALKDSVGFKAFESSFGADDRIFIISSIFGGTGAAGFPLLLKKFRNHSKITISECQIGALTVMPYFKLSEPTKVVDETTNEESLSSDIDSNNFLTKTKSALTYYIRPDFSALYNSLYYIGDIDKQDTPYNNNEKNQDNKAHIVELIGALAVIKFAESDNNSRSEIFEYCLKGNDIKVVNFTNIGDETSSQIGLNLTSLRVMCDIDSINRQYKNLPFNKDHFWTVYQRQSNFFVNFQEFSISFFLKWLRELGQNERAFRAFGLEGKQRFNNLVFGKEVETGFLEGLKSKPFDMSQVHLEMAKSEDTKENKRLRFSNPIGEYMSVCFDGISKVINSNIKF